MPYGETVCLWLPQSFSRPSLLWPLSELGPAIKSRGVGLWGDILHTAHAEPSAHPAGRRRAGLNGRGFTAAGAG